MKRRRGSRSRRRRRRSTGEGAGVGGGEGVKEFINTKLPNSLTFPNLRIG